MKIEAMIDSTSACRRAGSIFCLLLLSLMLGACGTLATKVVTFSSAELTAPAGTIQVVAVNSEVEPSLEFAHYKDVLQRKLAELGYQPVATEDADYIALLDYDVSEVTEKRSSNQSRIYIDSEAHVRRGSKTVVVVDDEIDMEYDRIVKLIIAKNTPERPRLYEVTGVSDGDCKILSTVFDEMIEAMLREFPAPNGTVKTIWVKGDIRC